MATIMPKSGDIFLSSAQILVNPVNCVGVMGAGLARQFRNRYPEMYRQYREDCRNGRMETGRVIMYRVRDGRTVAAFPTKKHWENPSRLEYIQAGLLDLRGQLATRGPTVIAVPALGAGLGKLEWNDVRGLVIDTLDLPDLTVELYEPQEGARRRRR